MNVERENHEPLILNDPGRWEDPIFQQITIQSFVSLGLSKKGENILKRVFASNAIAGLDDLLKIVEDMDEDKELKKEALRIVKVAKSSSDYNDTCYVTGTKEKVVSRDGQTTMMFANILRIYSLILMRLTLQAYTTLYHSRYSGWKRWFLLRG